MTASPDYQFLAPYVALASAAVWVGMLIWFLVSNRHGIRSGVTRLGSWYFIIPCIGLAFLAVAAAAYGLGLRAVPQASAIQKGEVTPSTANASGLSKLINNPRIEQDNNGDVWLTGTYAKSGGELIAYVNFFTARGFNPMFGAPEKTMSAGGAMDINSNRIETDRIDRFDRGTPAKIRIGTIYTKDNQVLVQWGKNGASMGAAVGSYFGFIILVDKERSEDIYKFALIGRMIDPLVASAPPVFISPDIFNALEESAKNAK